MVCKSQLVLYIICYSLYYTQRLLIGSNWILQLFNYSKGYAEKLLLFNNLSHVLLNTSKINLKPYGPIRGVLNEAQVLKKSVGDSIVLLYEAVHRVPLSEQPLCHGADQHFSITFPSVFGKSVQNPHGAVVVDQKPGHWMALFISDAA